MKISELLPIGSVVLLKNGKKRVMIIGVKQREKKAIYDYIGVVYPEGSLGVRSQVLFNHDNVDKIYFRGYEDSERDEFIQKLTEYYEKTRD